MPAKPRKPTLPPKERAVRAALALAAENGWPDVTLSDIARKAGMRLAELREHIEDRFDILAVYGRMIDRRTLEACGEPDETLSVRDRLFDLMMERFDALSEDRDGLVSILKSMPLDPKQALVSLPHLGRSMSWMLEASGIETQGWTGALKILGLTAVYLHTLKSWMEDESEDLSATMAALDKNLARAESWAGMLRIV